MSNASADQPRNHPTGASRFSNRVHGTPEVEVVPNPPVDENGREIRPGYVFWSCTRCTGKGVIRGFANVAGGVCFECLGAGGEYISDAVAKRRRSAAGRRQAKREAEQAARMDALDESRRDEGWTLDDARDVTGDEENARLVYQRLWAGHEAHPQHPAEPIPAEWGIWPE